ncbi:MAG: hypothetical protein KC635_19475 [Myxococcales bacterium]|nr:hypothetical protein [Myxococcales bacterium]
MTLLEAEERDCGFDVTPDHEPVLARLVTPPDAWEALEAEDFTAFPCGGAAGFLDAEGYRFYLPALMRLVLRDAESLRAAGDDARRRALDDATVGRAQATALRFVYAIQADGWLRFLTSARDAPAAFRALLTSPQRAAVVAFLRATAAHPVLLWSDAAEVAARVEA